jgi:hypothetical protein
MAPLGLRPSSWIARWAGRLRFPNLLALTAGLFFLDLLITDLIPFADELLLGLATAVLAMWREDGGGPPPGDEPRVVKNVTPPGGPGDRR